MAKLVTETAVPLTSDSDLLPRFYFYTVPYDEPEFDTIAERLYCRVEVFAERDTDNQVTKYRENVQVSDALDTFDAGDAATLRGLLLKLYNHTVAAKNL